MGLIYRSFFACSPRPLPLRLIFVWPFTFKLSLESQPQWKEASNIHQTACYAYAEDAKGRVTLRESAERLRGLVIVHGVNAEMVIDSAFDITHVQRDLVD